MQIQNRNIQQQSLTSKDNYYLWYGQITKLFKYFVLSNIGAHKKYFNEYRGSKT